MRERAAQIAAAVGLDIDHGRPVAGVTLADRQLIAIARAMSHQPRLLILDEPTSSLSATETKRLFALIERLRDQGVAILYISHRCPISAAWPTASCQCATAASRACSKGQPLDYSGAVRAMLGHEINEVDIRPPPARRC